jgi:hypothetical protein
VSADRQVTRIVRSWLEEGVTALPDRVLDAVLDQVPATRQRRAWWPAWRLPKMITPFRFAGATVAVAVVAVLALVVIGFNFRPTSEGAGGSSLTPVPTATPAPTPGPSLGTLQVGDPTTLAPGTYVAGDPFPLRVTFTVPAGWEGTIGGPYAVFLDQVQSGSAVTFSINPTVFADPCHYKGPLNPQPGPSVDDLATALASLPGLTATTPTAATVGELRYQGKQLTLTAPASFAGCTLSADGAFRIWQLPLGATNDLAPGEVDRVWILDVAGQRLVIDAFGAAGATEVQGILDSIQIAALN